MNIIHANLNYRKPLIKLNLNKVFFIILHHVDIEYATPEQIHQWHLENGWSGAGYNEYIRKDGTVVIMRGDHIGAQCKNLNSKSYGIALEGNYDKETIMPPAQFKALVERLKFHKKRLPNNIEIVPHSKFSNTSCPGKYLNLDLIKQSVYKIHDVYTLEDNVEYFSKFIPITPAYWLKYARPGETCRGDYAAGLIANVTNYLRKVGG